MGPLGCCNICCCCCALLKSAAMALCDLKLAVETLEVATL
jgi:hypothetical protein